MTQFLICGAGPVGMAAAIFLHEKGASVRIIDKESSISELSRALLINPSTLGKFEPLEITPKLLQEGLKLHGINIYAGTKKLVHIDLDNIPSKYNFGLALPQNHTEKILEAELKARGIEIERGVEFQDYREENDRIVSQVIKNELPEEIVSQYLIGADGYQSRVRRSAKIDFAGKHLGLVLHAYDIEVEPELPFDQLHLFMVGNFMGGYFPFKKDRCRFITNHPSFEAAESKMIHRKKIFWNTDFHISSRLAASFSKGRVYLMGDAAHVHSPVGGRGMNNGIEDAWVFAECYAKGDLGLYSQQRREKGKKIVQETKLATQLMLSTNPLLGFVRKHLLPIVFKNTKIKYNFAARNMGLI